MCERVKARAVLERVVCTRSNLTTCAKMADLSVGFAF